MDMVAIQRITFIKNTIKCCSIISFGFAGNCLQHLLVGYEQRTGNDIGTSSDPLSHSTCEILILHFNILSTWYFVDLYTHGCTNPRRQISRATKFCTAAFNICGSSVWNRPRIIISPSVTLRWLSDFWKTYAPLLIGLYSTWFCDILKRS
jgi:hypothetical protein